jgi:hypothetical protein
MPLAISTALFKHIELRRELSMCRANRYIGINT